MARVNKKLKTQQYDGKTTTRVTMKGEPFEQLSWVVRSTYGEEGPNEVTFYRLNQILAVESRVKYGDVFDVVYNKKTDEFTIRKTQLPESDTELVLWLFDLPKRWRAKTADEYRRFRDQRLESIIQKNNSESLHWQKEFIIAGGKLMFAQATPDSEPICLVGRIMPEFLHEAFQEILTDRELRGLLAYEDIAIRAIAQDRFGFTQEDFNLLRI